ncbi:MAG TPA: NAD(P)H-hydrate dehydratase [Chitinophagaceae bacterium]|jgi:NAD(P)H-hydrate epimerase|nr:NAD(P)H-hydrate dehydratase [Chitinophagaceae bacterium]
MKILSAAEIRAWDEFTIANEPVASIDLMERAATACVEWLITHYPAAPSFGIFCGKGNNGGDGLAIARMLMEKNYSVSIHILEFGHKGTDDFQINLARLQKMPLPDIHFVQSEQNFHPIPPGQVIIDALFGSGLNRNLEDVTANLVHHINASGAEVIAIDIPSGLFTDRSSKGNTIVVAQHTLSFQCYKPALLFAENADFIGETHILDIGLSPAYYNALDGQFELLDENSIHSIHRPRKRFSHKGNFGHALLVAGSYGKIGAAVLSAKACLRSGAGLLTCHLPKCGYDIMQISLPEAMVMTDFNSSFNTKVEDDLTRYDAIGIGPGIGQASETKMLLRELFDSYRNPMVIDADALNILGSQKDLLQLIPAGSILSPHPKEFGRLFGETANEFDRVFLALQKAKELKSIIIVKGHHSFIATPDGKGFFNNTGNAGMATAGSGDVLTGILTGLLAQGYSSVETAILGVYLHGLAGDLAAEEISMEAMIAEDIVDYIGNAYGISNR